MSDDSDPRDLERRSAPEDPRAVADRLANLPETTMRAAVLSEVLERMSTADAAWLLDVLATSGRAGGPPFDLALLAALDMVAESRLPYALQRRIFEEADRLNLLGCKELLYTPGLDPTATETATAPRPLVPGTKPLTLGERKSLARGWKRDVLEKLLVDPAVDVIALLLDNPRVTEDDILRIATSRRAAADTLLMILGHRRWKTRPRIRRALLLNPRIPEAVAVRLVGLLPHQEVVELSRDPQLPLRVIAALRRRRIPRS